MLIQSLLFILSLEKFIELMGKLFDKTDSACLRFSNLTTTLLPTSVAMRLPGSL